MRAHLVWLLVLAVLAFGACSDDEESPMAPEPNPTPTRYVDAAAGDDGNAGTSAEPWATITYALATADEGDVIRVAPGTYDAANGEVFPMVMKAGQKLIGDVPNKGAGATPTIIQGEAAYDLSLLEGITILGTEGSRIAGLTLVGTSNQNFYAVVGVDGVAMEIDNNTFPNGTYAGVNSTNGATPNIHHNLFQTRTYSLFMDDSENAHVHRNVMEGATGIRIFNSVDCIFEYNDVRTTQVGMTVAGTGMIRNNTFASAGFTFAALDVPWGTVVIRNNTVSAGPALRLTDTGAPDLGTHSDPGGNDFSSISGVVINHEGTESVTAIGNDWPNEPPIAGDIVITSTGSVVTEW